MPRFTIGLTASLPVYIQLVIDAPSAAEAIAKAERKVATIDPDSFKPCGHAFGPVVIDCTRDDDQQAR